MRLNKYLPEVLYNGRTLNKIYTAQENKLNEIDSNITDLINQKFVKTATWSLDTWESEHGIITDYTLSYESRRNNILLKMQGYGVFGTSLINQLANIYDCACIVTFYPTQYYFNIKFTGIGIPINLTAFQAAIESLKPAHLGVTYSFTYNTWDYASGFTWNTLATHTWDDVEEGTL